MPETGLPSQRYLTTTKITNMIIFLRAKRFIIRIIIKSYMKFLRGDWKLVALGEYYKDFSYLYNFTNPIILLDSLPEKPIISAWVVEWGSSKISYWKTVVLTWNRCGEVKMVINDNHRYISLSIQQYINHTHFRSKQRNSETHEKITLRILHTWCVTLLSSWKYEVTARNVALINNSMVFVAAKTGWLIFIHMKVVHPRAFPN